MTTGSSKWIRRARRLAIYARDRMRCVWCTQPVGVEQLGLPHDATLDHVRPRDDGGSNKTENLVTCCARCNARRRHMSAYDFAVYIVQHMRGDSPATVLARVLAAITKPLAGCEPRDIDRRQVAVVKRACAPRVQRHAPRK